MNQSGSLPFPGFMPSGDYAITAQREDIERIRKERDAAEDRETFYKACLTQHMAESQARIADLAEQLSLALSERDMAISFVPTEPPADPRVDGELANTISTDEPEQADPDVVRHLGGNGAVLEDVLEEAKG